VNVKLVGCLLLVSGCFVVLAALVLMRAFVQKAGFAAAGIAVEALGLGMLIRAYGAVAKEKR
jgi:hypothetical protein